VKLGSAGVEEVHNITEKFCLYIDIVTYDLKAATCPSAGQGFMEHVPMVT
jgi:hypothetical protein